MKKFILALFLLSVSGFYVSAQVNIHDALAITNGKPIDIKKALFTVNATFINSCGESRWIRRTFNFGTSGSPSGFIAPGGGGSRPPGGFGLDDGF